MLVSAYRHTGSEAQYHSDTEHAAAKGNFIYGPKIEISKYVESKAAEAKITYTNVITGMFLDWGQSFLLYISLDSIS